MNKIKLYTQKEIVPKGVQHTFMLIPFWGAYSESSSDPDAGRFKQLSEKGGGLYELVDDPKLSDYFLLPFGYSFESSLQAIIKAFLKKAKENNKRTLVFYNSDDDTKISHEGVLVFRTSFNAGARSPYEHALPGWSVDFMKYFESEKITYCKKDKISVSYCGYVDGMDDSLLANIKRIFNSKRDHESVARAIRGRACRVLKKNTKIECNFIIRDGFWAGGLRDKMAARKEYAINMIQSLYAIVARGGGNFSYRLYEVLSCGRIPIFIYTDCVLPFEDDIKWKEHVVWVDAEDNAIIDQKLLDFHKQISEEDLCHLQIKNRLLYENYLSPYGFFKHLHKKLNNNEL